MILGQDLDTAAWLDALEAGPESFEWDRGNTAKDPKHEVEAGDVESMFASSLVFAGRILEPVHDEPRWLVLGRSRSGRRLALVFTRRGDRVRPISCRPMRRVEREIYEETLEP